MKFVLFDLISNHPNGVSGELLTSQERIQQAIDQAVFAESLGFDGYGVGERHGAPFLSSSPAILLTAIAARTSKIRLLPTVSVLSILDPVRVAEDYATLDHLSGGRLEMMIGKGNDPRHYPLFGIKEEEQWASLAERYDFLKRLWTEENVSWEGTYRPPLYNVTTEPRPFQKQIPIWHGSASSPISTELAAKNGEPIFSSNAFHPMGKYKELIDHYRERLEYYGYDSNKAIVGAGAGSLYLANTTEEAIKRFRPYYDIQMNSDAAKHNQSPFKNLEDHIQHGSALIGSVDLIIEKILKYHQAFGHQVQAIGVGGLSVEEQYEQLDRFAEEVIPVLRREIPSTVWEEEQSTLI
ncbi:alkanesulfonate monooxygenase SsuD/methylene tetrahydromethanopterin reductase-like flavin-dependent oxidoreductase (luciferase family) [Neobacillus niacini]|uniref:LLM class flavin-dependent oxidoreductase n=1 Tax=Neobacillus driksii TaxID=3035913 RepID=UPI0027836DC8|nr:LLM class flavin-dependent oxidoreductase [Neobacillus niacini]MDQ0972138.1 alkanesulfonate monooxygenase SsuD/methylene tetrahydromethanopterin reductase-like flavin-dependent oxidoreductase (luciferase family) [Neobacillus niacini]